MSHTCSSALLRCIDFRLEPAIHDFLVSRGLAGDCDVISFAGATKGLAQDASSVLADQLKLSKKLHDIKTVVLMNHTDCGAYGGRAAFQDEEAERNHHRKDLAEAQRRVCDALEDVRVICALAIIEMDGSVHIEELDAHASDFQVWVPDRLQEETTLS